MGNPFNHRDTWKEKCEVMVSGAKMVHTSGGDVFLLGKVLPH